MNEENFIKECLRKVFIDKDEEFMEKNYKKYQKAKEKLHPKRLLELQMEIAFEEFRIMSDNHHLSDLKN